MRNLDIAKTQGDERNRTLKLFNMAKNNNEVKTTSADKDKIANTISSGFVV